MADVRLYEAIVIDTTPDPTRPGHIRVRIPELYRDEEVPCLIPPMYPGWTAGGWHSVPGIVDPDTEEAESIRVIVAHMGRLTFRWIGTSQTFSSITDNPGVRCGARSGDGRHRILLDNVLGAFITVASDADPGGVENFLNIDPSDNAIQLQTADGTFIQLNATQVGMLNAAGDILMLDSDNGVVLMHKDGIANLSLRTGDVAALSGTVVQISGGSIEMGDGVIPPVHPYVLTLSYLAAVKLLADEVVLIGAGIPAGLAIPTPGATALSAGITTSLGAGAPYLSTRIFGD